MRPGTAPRRRSPDARRSTRQAVTGAWSRSLVEAKEWLTDSLAHADELDVGSGAGPIHHFHRLWST